MNCQDVEDNLERFVLGAVSSARAARVRSHLARCPSCRAAAEQLHVLLGEVRRASPAARPRAAFAADLRSALQAETARQRRRRLLVRSLRFAGAVAACLLLGLGIWAAAQALGPVPSPPPHGRQAGPAGHAGEAQWRYLGAMASPATQADDVVIQGDSLYVLCKAGVVAVDRRTGRRRWAWEHGSTGYLSATARHVFCLARGGDFQTELVALRGDTGEALWRFSPDSMAAPASLCRPVALGGDRICWTHGGQVFMLGAADGQRIWQQTVEHGGPLSGVVANRGALYVGGGAAICCLDSQTGSIRWRQRVGRPSPRLRQPLLAALDGRVYYLQRSLGPRGRLFCIDLASRRSLWEKRVVGIHCLRAGSEGIYLRGTEIIAFSVTGQRRWSRRAEGCGPLTLIGELVCYVDTRRHGSLAALDRHTGEPVWDVDGIRSCDGFAQVGGTGYIKTQDGTVLAIAMR